MIVTKFALGALGVIYLVLWILALNGATSLIPLLMVPLILAILVGVGNLLQGFIGIPGRSPKFHHPEDDDTK